MNDLPADPFCLRRRYDDQEDQQQTGGLPIDQGGVLPKGILGRCLVGWGAAPFGLHSEHGGWQTV